MRMRGISIYDRVMSGRPPADEKFAANNAAVGTRVLIFNSNSELKRWHLEKSLTPLKHHTGRKCVDLFGQR
jgi:hypothetical protein